LASPSWLLGKRPFRPETKDIRDDLIKFINDLLMENSWNWMMGKFTPENPINLMVKTHG